MGVRKIMLFLKHFEQVSGQKISFEKNNIYVGIHGNEQMLQLLTGFSALSLPFTYLGAPIFLGRRKIELFYPLLDRIRSKFSGWNLSFLSQGGRWTIIKNVLVAMPIYLMQVLNPPKNVLKLIDKIIS